VVLCCVHGTLLATSQCSSLNLKSNERQILADFVIRFMSAGSIIPIFVTHERRKMSELANKPAANLLINFSRVYRLTNVDIFRDVSVVAV